MTGCRTEFYKREWSGCMVRRQGLSLEWKMTNVIRTIKSRAPIMFIMNGSGNDEERNDDKTEKEWLRDCETVLYEQDV